MRTHGVPLSGPQGGDIGARARAAVFGHGSAAGASYPRSEREREGRGRSLSGLERDPDIRTGPAGPQERGDWMDALRDANERNLTLENLARTHAQTIASNAQIVANVNEKLVSTVEDIAAYKLWVNKVLFDDKEAFRPNVGSTPREDG